MEKITIGGIIKTSLVAAFTIAAALLWKDVITELINTFAPKENVLTYNFIVAIIATVFVVFAIYSILTAEKGAEKILKKLKSKKIKKGGIKEYELMVKHLRQNYDKKTDRKLKDMKNQFENKEEVKNKLSKSNPTIYTIYSGERDANNDIALTVVNPGKIGKEFYMTKGHKHRAPLPETYILLEGEGKLVLQNKSSQTVKLKKGKRFEVPGKSAHRVVNTGKGKMKVLTVYPKKAGHDYNVNFEKRVLK